MATQKLERGVTPAGIAAYPWLNKPDTKFSKAGVYKTNLILSGEDAAPLVEKLTAMTNEWVEQVKADVEEQIQKATDGKKKKALKDFLADMQITFPFEDDVDDEGESNGDVCFKFKANASYEDKKTGKTVKITVPLVDAKKRPTKVPVFGGSKIKVAYSINPYSMPATKSVGLSLRLNAVQIIELSKGGGGDYGFGEEDGYESSDDDNGYESENPGAGMGDDSGDDEDF